MSNCSFNCGLMDSVVVILKEGTDYMKQRLGLIYDYLLSPYDIVDRTHDPDVQERQNNRNAIIEKIRKIYGFYGINLNQETP